jgi:hypothetical protein
MSLKISFNEIEYNTLTEQKTTKERYNPYIYLTPKINKRINRMSRFKPNKHKIIKEVNHNDINTITGVNLLYIFENL